MNLNVASGTLTLGSSVTVMNASQISGNGGLINNGTIETATTQGLTINLSVFQSPGTLQASNGSTLSVTGLSGTLGAVIISGASEVSIAGSNYVVGTNLSVAAGQTLKLDGVWTAANGVTINTTGGTLGLGSTTSLTALTLANTTISIEGNYTTAQVLALLNANPGNHLAIGAGGLIDNSATSINNPFSLDAIGSLTLMGGTLKGGVVRSTGSAEIVATALGGTLDGVTLSVNLDITGQGTQDTTVTVKDGVTLLNGSQVTIQDNSSTGQFANLDFSNTESVSGNGAIHFLPISSTFAIGSMQVDATLTIGSGITITGGNGSAYGGTVINQGIIDADGAGSSLDFNFTAFTNQGTGTIEATNGGSLNLSGFSAGLGNVVLSGANSSLTLNGTNYTVDSTAFANVSNGQALTLLGTWTPTVNITVNGATFGLGQTAVSNFNHISLTNATLSVNGHYKYSDIATLLGAGNHLAISAGGILDNSNNTINLDNIGSLSLTGGTLLNGSVTASSTAAGSPEVDVIGFGSVLDGVTLGANLDLTAVFANADVQDGLTLQNNATITIGDPAGHSTAALTFTNTETLGGTGAVKFGAATNDLMPDTLDVDETLTIGPGITIQGGGSGDIGYGGDVINEGVIDADGSGASIFINNYTFTNQGAGKIEAANGGTLSVEGFSGTLSQGQAVVSGAGSSVSIDVGPYNQYAGYTVDSSFTLTNGETLDLGGTWTAGPHFAVSANAATFGLGNVSNLSGTALTSAITLSNGATLQVLGNYTYAALQPLLAGNVLAVGPGGVLTNNGNPINLTAATGSLTLDGGTLQNVTVNASGGAEVVVTGVGSTLDGVTLGANLDLTAAAAEASVINGLTLANSTITIGDLAGHSASSLYFTNTETLGVIAGDTGTVQFGTSSNTANSPSYEPNILGVYTGDTLTVGAGITVQGNFAGDLGAASNFIDDAGTNINVGVIDADGASANLAINTGTLINQGTLEATNGGALTVNNLAPNAGTIKSGAGSLVSIVGNLIQTATGVIAVDLGGALANQFGQLKVSGLAQLAGALDVSLVNGFTPTAGTAFKIITVASELGTFAAFNGPANTTFTVFYDPTDITVKD